MTATDIRAGQPVRDAHTRTAGPEQTTRTDHVRSDAHPARVGAGTDSRASQDSRGNHGEVAGSGPGHPTGQTTPGNHLSRAGGAQTPEPTREAVTPNVRPSARAQDTAAAKKFVGPSRRSPLPPDSPNGQDRSGPQVLAAVGGSDSATPAIRGMTPIGRPPGVAGEQGQPANHHPRPIAAPLADPTLALLADVLDDLERTRIANENRLRQLTRDEPDKDGEERGFGLTEDHPDVARLASVVRGIAELEHQATLNLAKVMRAHPLGPWVKAQKGVGEKQAARLLAAIGDPYWNYLHDRPRTVSELWAYCGLHVLPAGQPATDDHHGGASGGRAGNPDHGAIDAQDAPVGVAARRKKGERANWSTAAKMRAWNIAGSMLKAGNREVYDRRKAATEGREHAAPCVRCGPSGKPAQPGSPWSDAHRHADALRIVSKDLLKQLWLAARDIHLGQSRADSQSRSAVVEQP